MIEVSLTGEQRSSILEHFFKLLQDHYETALKVAHLEAVQRVLEHLSEKPPSQAYTALEQEARLLLKGFLSIDGEEEHHRN